MATPCPFCEKKGLPILPVRYGIAPTKTFGDYKVRNAPPDATKLLGPAEVPMNVPETIYTGRVLRPGYLFVFYETHKYWEAYSVDTAGCLSSVPVTGDTPPGGDRFHDSCKRNATKMANASVVTIQDPETAGKVWFGFSDVWWTKAVRGKNAGLSSKDRAKFMRLVDVGAWFNKGQPGSTPEHAFQIYQVDMIVAEYAMTLVEEVSALGWSPFFYRDIISAKSLKEECDALMPTKGLVLGLQDPAGIARELSAYMNARWAGFSKRWQREVDVEAGLTRIQAAVERQAETNLYNDRAKEAMENYGQLMNSGGTAFMLESYRKEMQPLLDEAKKIKFTAAELEKARTDAWRKYKDAIDPNKRADFHRKYDPAANQYDAQFMKPLGNAHAAWMISAAMNAVFDWHFDPDDINTGVCFTGVFATCIMGTGGYGPCVQLYDKWMQSGLSGNNPFWRMMLFNHPTLKAKAAQAGGGEGGGKEGGGKEGGKKESEKKEGSEGGGLKLEQWASLFEIYKSVVGKLKLAGENAYKTIDASAALEEVIEELGPSMIRVLKQRGAAGEDLMKVMGMHAGMPVAWVQVTGTRRDVYSALYGALEKLQPAASGPDKADRAVATQARMAILEAELKGAGLSMDDKVSSWSILLDAEHADTDALYRLPSETQAQMAAKRVLSVTKTPGLQLASSVAVDSYMGRMLTYMRAPGMLASVSMVFSVLGFGNAHEEEGKALKSERNRALASFTAACTGLTAASLEVVGSGIKSAAVRRLPLLGATAKALGGGFLRYIELGGAGAGAVGAWIAVGVDTVNATEAFGNGERGVATLYVVRAGAEGALAFGLTRALIVAIISGGEVEALGPPAWIATAVIIVVSVLIDIFKAPPTLTWTRNCLWGSDHSYDSGPEEQADFKKAIAGQSI
ncbi:T6SS effector BTH_I2691 family protein [Paraburkholderia fungorum]|uniref:T6SS effector BTH_I2691 family protein n=1 Tax=Paraburkholderia fungorum TaxID=134537 RepID=UPI001C1EB104|nr:T6SS effector BTH_I2691 family protein [Paraburkholderia fungorum]MBU7438565.1 hypothetical protein [Paraburkholderia fungorum]